MDGITDSDRQAAEALRGILAEVSGFWFRPGDDSPLVRALARHRAEAERRLADKLTPFLAEAEDPGNGQRDVERALVLPAPKVKPLGPLAA